MEEEIRVKPNVTVEPVEEGISCKLDSFEPKICGPEPTLILFLGKNAEGTDEVVQTLMSRQDDLDVNAGVLDLADESCQELSEKYKIDREATQLVLFKDCQKMGAVALSADNVEEQLGKIKEIIKGLVPSPQPSAAEPSEPGSSNEL